MSKWVYSFLVLLLPFWGYTQNKVNSLDLTSNEPFYLVVNNTLICESPQESYSFLYDTISNFYLINDSSSVYFEWFDSSINGTKKVFDVFISDKKIALLPITSMTNKDTIQETCNKKGVWLKNADSLLTQVFGEKDLDSTNRCFRPMSLMDFTNWMNSIQNEILETGKLKAIEKKLSSNTKACLSAKQVESLLLIFEFDDKKLALGEKLVHHSMLPQNLYEIDPKFLLKDSKSKWHSLIDESLKKTGL